MAWKHLAKSMVCARREEAAEGEAEKRRWRTDWQLQFRMAQRYTRAALAWGTK